MSCHTRWAARPASFLLSSVGTGGRMEARSPVIRCVAAWLWASLWHPVLCYSSLQQ